MSGWNDEPQQPREQSRSILIDMVSLGPASTPGRELVLAVAQIAIAYLLVLVIVPDRLPDPVRWAVLIGAPAFFAVRALAGIPKWRRRRR